MSVTVSFINFKSNSKANLLMNFPVKEDHDIMKVLYTFFCCLIASYFHPPSPKSLVPYDLPSLDGFCSKSPWSASSIPIPRTVTK